MNEDTASLIDAIRSAPPGTFKLFRATDEEPEVEQSMRNWDELSRRIQRARAANCLIEVVSLRMQYMDVWLRIFFENTPHTDKRRREFGRLLEQCFKLGLKKRIYDQIITFNRHRIAAIHGYMVGKTNYDVIGHAVQDSDGLAEALCEFVLVSSGEIVDESFATTYHKRGDMIFNIPAMIGKLKSSPTM